MRTTYGKARHKAKKRLFKKARGNRGGRGNLLRTVKETLIRAGVYAYRDRKVRKREFRKLWIIRLNAAARERGLRYSEFIYGLKKVLWSLHKKLQPVIVFQQANKAQSADTTSQEPGDSNTTLYIQRYEQNRVFYKAFFVALVTNWQHCRVKYRTFKLIALQLQKHINNCEA